MRNQSTRSLAVPHLIHDLVSDRIQTLHKEAAEQRLVLRVQRLRRARRDVKRANERLHRVLSREFCWLRRKRLVKPWLRLAACALLAGVAAALATARSPSAELPAGVDATARVEQVVQRRCVSCHADHPTQAGFAQPPKGVVLQTREQLLQHAAKVSETVASRYMPIGNLTGMTDEERGWVAGWYAGLPR